MENEIIDDELTNDPEDNTFGSGSNGSVSDPKQQEEKKKTKSSMRVSIGDVDDLHGAILGYKIELQAIVDKLSEIEKHTTLPENLQKLNDLKIEFDPKELSKNINEQFEKIDLQKALEEAVRKEIEPLLKVNKNLLFEKEKENAPAQDKPKNKGFIVKSFIFAVALVIGVYTQFFDNKTLVSNENLQYLIKIKKGAIVIYDSGKTRKIRSEQKVTSHKLEKGYFHIKVNNKDKAPSFAKLSAKEAFVIKTFIKKDK
jgi:hypothetical protein